MLLGANTPYDCDIARIPDVVSALATLGAEAVVVTSHESVALYEALHSNFPGLRWYIRLKGNRAWWPSTPLDSGEWESERSPREAIQWCLANGITPYVLLWNEGDIELPPDWQADEPTVRDRAWDMYSQRAAEAISDLRRSYHEQVKIALAPLSQGNPERFGWWQSRYIHSGLLDRCDFIAEHCYSPVGSKYDDPHWGGRWKLWSGRKPVHITETNLNGYAGADERLTNYLRSLRDSGEVESACLFTLSGGKDDAAKPPWWFLTNRQLGVVREALYEALGDESDGSVPEADSEAIPVSNVVYAIDTASYQGKGRSYRAILEEHKPQHVVIHCYTDYEANYLFDYTRDQVQQALAFGATVDPYVWCFRFADPAETVRQAVNRWRALGVEPCVLWLDEETYKDSSTFDPGPDADWLRQAKVQADRLGVRLGHYTGYWWVRDWLPGGADAFAEFSGWPLWLANYTPGNSELDVWQPFSGFSHLSGRQWSADGIDRDVFLETVTPLRAAPAPAPEPPRSDAVVHGLQTALADVCDRQADQIEAVLQEMRAVREQFLGPRG